MFDMKFFKNLFYKQEKEPEPKTTVSSNDTFVDVIISLNKQLEVDIALYIDCDYKKANIDLTDYILVCSKFLSFDENKLKTQMINILDNQIKNDKNKLFINGLVAILEKKSPPDTIDNFYIKPSQVFVKHIHEHQ